MFILCIAILGLDIMDSTVPLILYKFAEELGSVVDKRTLLIPEKYGSGSCSAIMFNPYVKMLICDYLLYKELLIENPAIDTSKRILFFKFQNISLKQQFFPDKQIEEKPVVMITNSRGNIDPVLSIRSNKNTINIEIDASYIKEQLPYSSYSPILQGLLQDTRPLLFEELIYPSLHKLIIEIVETTANDNLALYFLKLKTEELICKLLIELEKRNEKQLHILNELDIKAIYNIREQILGRLDTPPLIKDLSILAGMSPTKLKRLFKQIFGYSIFNYYQQFRMQEGARLLKYEKLSVSEVGYKLGFTNLSHFARVFYQYMDVKPKQYALINKSAK